MSVGSELLNKSKKAATEPEVSVTELRRVRDGDRRAASRQLADCSGALQRHQPGTPMYARVVEMLNSLLDQIARLDRMDDAALRTTYGPRYGAVNQAALAEAKRKLNTPEARQQAKEAVWAETAKESARRGRLEAIEAEVKLAREEAAAEAERQVRVK